MTSRLPAAAFIEVGITGACGGGERVFMCTCMGKGRGGLMIKMINGGICLLSQRPVGAGRAARLHPFVSEWKEEPSLVM